MDLIEKLALTDAEILEQFETAMVDSLRVGLTGIHDAASPPNDMASFMRRVPLANLLLCRTGIRSHYVGRLMRGVYP